jgi:hypothetical protein
LRESGLAGRLVLRLEVLDEMNADRRTAVAEEPGRGQSETIALQ